MGSDFCVKTRDGCSLSLTGMQAALRLVGLLPIAAVSSDATTPAPTPEDDKRPLADRLALALVRTQNKYDSEQDRAAAIVQMLGLQEG